MAEVEKKAFDFNVDVKDPKTGQVIKRNDHRIDFRKGPSGDTIQFIEQPIGSGKWFHVNNVPLTDEELVSYGYKAAAPEEKKTNDKK